MAGNETAHNITSELPLLNSNERLASTVKASPLPGRSGKSQLSPRGKRPASKGSLVPSSMEETTPEETFSPLESETTLLLSTEFTNEAPTAESGGETSTEVQSELLKQTTVFADDGSI